MATACYFVLVSMLTASATPAAAQELPRQALGVFPGDTHEFAYANLSDLRSLPDYPVIRQGFLVHGLEGVEELLCSVTSDAAAGVEQVTLGWRSSDPSPFGLASGTFEAAPQEQSSDRGGLRSLTYRGFQLKAARSNVRGGQYYFTKLDRNILAFGELADLKAMIDNSVGDGSALNTNSNFLDYEAELEGSASEWGITVGTAAVNFVAPLLPEKARPGIDLSSVASPVAAVLYSLGWNGDFELSVSVICGRREDAVRLARLLTFLREFASKTKLAPNVKLNEFVQNLEIDQDGRRVEIQGTGPTSIFGLLLPAQPGSPWKPNPAAQHAAY